MVTGRRAAERARARQREPGGRPRRRRGAAQERTLVPPPGEPPGPDRRAARPTAARSSARRVADGAIVLRRDHRGRRPARGLGRRPGRRPVPADPAARPQAVQLQHRARRAGSASRSRRSCRSPSGGARAASVTFEPRAGSIRRGSPSSASAAASSRPSASRTASSSAGRTPTRTTARAAPRRSSWPSTARPPRSTCFCTSMGTGPEVRGGHDLVLTELDEGFVVRAGSAAGRRPAGPAAGQGRRRGPDLPRPPGRSARSRRRSATRSPTAGLHDRLLAQLDSPRWAEIAERCLACANCTMVCPTCFCSSVDPALRPRRRTSRRPSGSGTSASPRASPGSPAATSATAPRDRYRQWLTHKFATWIDQFGTFGCVGCGRCIAWCPVGIDVREELMAIAPPLEARPGAGPSPAGRRRRRPTTRPPAIRSSPAPRPATSRPSSWAASTRPSSAGARASS